METKLAQPVLLLGYFGKMQLRHLLQGGGGGDGVAGSPGEDRGHQEVGAGGGGQQVGA